MNYGFPLPIAVDIRLSLYQGEQRVYIFIYFDVQDYNIE